MISLGIVTSWTRWYGLLSGIIAHSLYIVLHSSPPKCFFVGPEPHGSFPFYGHPRCFALADVSARWMPCGMCQLSHHVDPWIDSSRMYGVVGLSSWYVEAGGMGSLLLRTLVMQAGVCSSESEPNFAGHSRPLWRICPSAIGHHLHK